jgi:hypothetical protein
MIRGDEELQEQLDREALAHDRWAGEIGIA